MPRLTHSLIALIFAGLLLGCDQAAAPNASNQATKSNNAASSEWQTFASAAQELVTLRNTIRDGFAANDVDAAHGPLHEVGHILEELPALAEKNGLSADDLAAIKSATEALFDAFGEVDKTLHGGEGSTYEEEATKIDSNVKIVADLAGVEDVPATNPTSPIEPVDSIAPTDSVEPVVSAAPADVPEPEPVPETEVPAP